MERVRGLDDGGVDLLIFETIFDVQNAKETASPSLGLDVHNVWNVFRLLDTDEGYAVEIDEFLVGHVRL